jgi:Tol biopolymer transport system component
VLLLVGLVLVLAIAAVSLFLIFLPSSPNGIASDTRPYSSIEAFYSADKNETSFIINGELLKDTIEGKCSSGYSVALDGSKEFVVDEDDRGYVVSAKGVVKVTEDAYSLAVISPDGSKVAYSDSSKKKLYIVPADGEAPVLVDEGDYCVADSFSKDGSTLVYTKMGQNSGKSTNFLMAYRNGKTMVLKSGLSFVMAVSDDGEIVYSFEYSSDDEGKSKLYCINTTSNDTVQFEAEAGDLSYAVINDNGTELIYTDSSGSLVYLNIDNPDKRVEIGKYDGCWPVQPQSTYGQGQKSLKGQFYYAYSFGSDNSEILADLVFLGEDLKTKVIAKDVKNCTMDDAAKEILYVKLDANSDAGSLYSMWTDFSSNPVELAEDVTSIDASGDLGLIYYLDVNNQLHCIQGSKKAKPIASNVSEYGITGGNTCYFVATDQGAGKQTLCYSIAGGDMVKVNGAEGKEVFLFSPDSPTVASVQNGNIDVYSLTGNGESKRILSNQYEYLYGSRYDLTSDYKNMR